MPGIVPLPSEKDLANQSRLCGAYYSIIFWDSQGVGTVVLTCQDGRRRRCWNNGADLQVWGLGLQGLAKYAIESQRNLFQNHGWP